MNPCDISLNPLQIPLPGLASAHAPDFSISLPSRTLPDLPVFLRFPMTAHLLQTAPHQYKVDPIHASIIKMNALLNTFGHENRLIFKKGKLDSRSTLVKLKEDANNKTQQVSEIAFSSQSCSFLSISKRMINYIKLSFYLLLNRIIKLANRFFNYLRFGSERKNILESVEGLVRLKAIDAKERAEFVVALKDKSTRNSLVQDLLKTFNENNRITDEEKSYLIKKSDDYIFIYLFVKELEMMNEWNSDNQLIGKSYRELEELKKKNERELAAKEISKWIQNLKKALNDKDLKDKLTKYEVEIPTIIHSKKSKQIAFVNKLVCFIQENKKIKLNYQFQLVASLPFKANLDVIDFMHTLYLTQRVAEQFNGIKALKKELETIRPLKPALNSDQFTILKEKLMELHWEHGLFLAATQWNRELNANKIIGDFRQQWDEINRQFQRIDPTNLHLFDHCIFSPKTNDPWPVNHEAFDVLEESSIESIFSDHQFKNRFNNPRVAVFTCRSGSGHIMATKAIAQSLPDCALQVAEVYDDILKPLDLISHIFSGKTTVEDFYNYLIKNEHNRTLMFLNKLLPKFISFVLKDYEKLIGDYVERERPEMLISTIPVVNSAFVNVAKKYNLPLLIVTTDVEVSAFFYGMKPDTCDLNYPKYKITLPYGKEIYNNTIAKQIPKQLQNRVVPNFGYPLRHQFSKEFSTEELEQIRKEFNIQPNEKVILTMIGGNGSRATKNYAEMLKKMAEKDLDKIFGSDTPVRMICLCGNTSHKNNRKLVKKINDLNEPGSRIRFTAHGFTSKIAQLASLPDMFAVISKPGGGITNEMVKKGIFLIFHHNGTVLNWERGNMNYCLANNLGVENPFIPFRKMGNFKRALLRTLDISKSQPRPKGRGKEEEACTSPSFSGYIRNPHLKEGTSLNLEEKKEIVHSHFTDNLRNSVRSMLAIGE